MDSLLGIKLGMTRIFDEAGRDIPVTVLQAGPCTISQVKSDEKDGYQAVQLAFLEQSEKKISKPLSGHFKKAGVSPARIIREVRTTELLKLGDEITVKIFNPGDMVKVTGTSKGKGFTGRMKRYNFHGGRASHGKKDQLRAGGSIGASSDPSRVFPGMRGAGRSGNARSTVLNLEIVRIMPETHQLMLKGAVPGPKNSMVMITKVQ
ncbi:50S ribosomal protein L3 [Candidatus Neomarinimicrobiota bacterium]